MPQAELWRLPGGHVACDGAVPPALISALLFLACCPCGESGLSKSAIVCAAVPVAGQNP